MRKILLTLFVLILGFGCFSNFGFGDVISNQNCGTNAGQVCYNDSFAFLRFGNNSPSLNNGDTIGFSANSVMKTSYPQYYKCYDSSDNLIYDGTSIGNGREPLLFFKVNGYCQWFGSFSNRVNFYDFSSVLTCPSCPEVDTGSILSGYILESEIDTNYCVNNDLCPVYENNSLLYINTIEHQSAPVINIDIPLEYDRDSFIDSGTFNLVISGNNVDYDYIDGIITTQNSKPSSEDFNKIITVLLPVFIPGLVIILFLFFIFKFIKKVF